MNMIYTSVVPTNTNWHSFYSTLSEALDRCKKKYQSRLKKMEQKFGGGSKGSTTAPSSNQNSIKSKTTM